MNVRFVHITLSAFDEIFMVQKMLLVWPQVETQHLFGLRGRLLEMFQVFICSGNEENFWGIRSLVSEYINHFRSYIGPCLVLLRCQKMSETVFVAFVDPLSEPVRRFSSCSTDFSQQIVQVVLFLFLFVFLFWNCRIITSNPPTSFPPKINKSWGICSWQENWIGKG
jgi:hypothetical protein